MKKIVAATVLFIFSLPAWAAPVTLQFTARVASKDSSAQYGLTPIAIGDQINGYFTYDSALTADTNTWDVVGQYPFSASNSSYRFQVISSTGSGILYDESGPLTQIITENNWSYPGYPTLDAFTVNGGFSKGGEVFTFWLYLQNRDTNLNVITSDALPSPPPAFDQFNYTKGVLSSSYSLGQVYFDLTSVAPVPLPGSLILMLSALTFFTRLIKTKKKS
ncbi:MAG: hypothetical protein HY081_04485 [Gammaproteobacteria bacterium]|nr:hypothetical protein [Gammaproteobacteria bacterium]